MGKITFERMHKSLSYTVPFIVLYTISRLYLPDKYLFNWTARNSYAYLWAVAMILAYFEKYYMATVLNIANIIGIFVGQFLGDYLRRKSVSLVTPDMSNQQIAQAHYHYGVAIWIITILIIVIVAVLIRFIKNKN